MHSTKIKSFLDTELNHPLAFYFKKNKGPLAGILPDEDVLAICKKLSISTEALMRLLLPLAKEYAFAPISNFQVGAIVLGDSGNLYFGANIEFLGQSLSTAVHAEQSAIANAIARHEHGIKVLAVNVVPCGFCRQFLNEIKGTDELQVIVGDEPAKPFASFLPNAFGPNNLAVYSGMLDIEDNGIQQPSSLTDKVVLEAFKQTNRAYAPYTQAYSGAAIELTNGDIFSGTLAENSAFNPGLAPLSAAIAQLIFSERKFEEIKRIVLVEMDNDQSSQLAVTTAVASSITDVKVEWFKILPKAAT